MSYLGVFFSAVLGATAPVFGALMMKCTFSMLFLTSGAAASSEMNKWVLGLLIIAIITGVSIGLRTYFFSYTSENVTENMRREVYESTMRKHMGWHDIRTNNSGVINGILAGDCSTLQGLCADGIGVYFESFFALAGAIGIAFGFSWPMALIACGLFPLMVIGSAVSASTKLGFTNQNIKADADLLAADVISNSKTVASFACDD